MTILLRPASASDEEFLYSVYASTRAEEMAQVSWTDQEKRAFLRMQFQAQYRFYTENYSGAEFQVILIENQPVGRLYLHRRKNEIRILDIALLPEYRNQGLGSTLLNNILEEGRQNNRSVTIHVERFNPALHLYQRLGFRLQQDKGIYYFMEWSPLEQTQHAG